MPIFRSPPGFSLVELLSVLTLVAIVVAAGAPRMSATVDRMRARAALDRAVVEVYRARMAAVESGRPARLVLGSGATGCVERLVLAVARPDGTTRTSTAPLDAGRTCIRHSGDSVLVYGARGMLRPPARSLFVAGGGRDSLVLSVSGRVRRSE